jgi:hypothetical protein
MRRRVILTTAAAAVVSAVMAATSGAVATKAVTLKLGDEFAVLKTHIICTAQISRTLVRGRKLIGCAFADRNGPVPKTYAVGLAVNGEAVLARVKADGTPQVVTRRKLSIARREAAKLYKLSPGDTVIVSGTPLACSINTSKGKPILVSCFLFDFKKNNARPNSYGIAITEGGAFLIRFDKNSKASIIKSAKHGA